MRILTALVAAATLALTGACGTASAERQALEQWHDEAWDRLSDENAGVMCTLWHAKGYEWVFENAQIAPLMDNRFEDTDMTLWAVVYKEKLEEECDG